MSDIEQAFRDRIISLAHDLGGATVTFPEDDYAVITLKDGQPEPDDLYDEDDPGPEPYDDYDEPDYVAEEVD